MKLSFHHPDSICGQQTAAKNPASPAVPTPGIGMIVHVRGIEYWITKVYPYGTIDVRATDGSGRCYRISGLNFTSST